MVAIVVDTDGDIDDSSSNCSRGSVTGVVVTAAGEVVAITVTVVEAITG